MFLFGPPDADAPRDEHHRYADRRGFFWLPCPLCSRFYGGHEWEGEYSSIRIEGEPPGMQTGICPVCTAEGRGRGEEIAPGFFKTPTYARMDLDLRDSREWEPGEAWAEYTGPRTEPQGGAVVLTREQLETLLALLAPESFTPENEKLYMYLDKARKNL